jgi:pimeloyl-ACP methyl ester carboxylesterase
MLDQNTPSHDIAHLAYDFRGSGAPLVFIHGVTFDRSTWGPIVERLASRHHCIAVDLPGHGESDGPPRPLDQLADAMNGLLNELEIESPLVVGHSMGAAVAAIYAANYPVRGVVLVDQATLVRPFAELAHQLEPALRSEHFHAAFEPIRQSIGVELLPEPQRSEIASRQRIQQDLILGYWDEMLTATPDDLQARIDREAQAISAPLLAVFGQTLDQQTREHLVRCVPWAEIEEWPGRGHMVHLVEPDRFSSRLAEFAETCFQPVRPAPAKTELR